MFPDLSYILHYLIGTAPDNGSSIVKTFGLFLVLAILSAAFLLYKEILRKEKLGLLKPVRVVTIKGLPASPMELISNGLMGFLLGFKGLHAFLHFDEFKRDAAGMVFSGEGHLIGGIVVALIFVALKYWERKKKQLPKPEESEELVYPHDRIGDITIVAAFSGIVGAKVFALIEDLPAFFQDPIGTFFSGSGMAIYGGLIGGFIGGIFYLKKCKITPIHILDAVAPGLIIAYGVGRLGCHLSGDGDWGIPVIGPNEFMAATYDLSQPPEWLSWLPEYLWSYDYPNNVIQEGVAIEGCDWRYCRRLETPVFPTSIYEIAMAFGIGGILWALRKRVVIPGMLFFIYLFFNGFERFWIEKIRVNDRYDIFGIQTTQAEFIAVVFMTIGILACLFLWRRYKTN